jgi:hypothetical protein
MGLQENSALLNRISNFIKGLEGTCKAALVLLSFPSCVCLGSRDQGLTKYSEPAGALVLGLPASITVRNTFLLFINHTICSILL